MKVPSIKRILPERFPELKWMPELLAPLNSFLEQIVAGVNRGLRISENFDGEVKTITVDNTAGGEGFPVKFRWTRTSTPTVAWIGRAREVTGAHTAFADPLFLDWEMTADGYFKVLGVPGLPAAKFNIIIIALAE